MMKRKRMPEGWPQNLEELQSYLLIIDKLKEYKLGELTKKTKRFKW